MDPFTVLPNSLHDKIFKLMPFCSFKDYSLVSKSWYEAIGNSPYCMDHLVLNYDQIRENENMKSLRKSTRKYRKLVIKVDCSSEKYGEQLGIQQRQIRSILFKFRHTLKSIETLIDIPKIKVLTSLKSLTFIKCKCWFCKDLYLHPTGILMTCKNTIETLTFKKQVYFLSTRHLKDVLKSMIHLKSLSILDNVFDDNPIDQFQFPVLHFLSINLNENKLRSNQLEFIVNHLPSLKQLKLRDVKIDCCGLQFINDTVEVLTADKIFVEDHLMFFPALKKLEIDYLSRNALETILMHPTITDVVIHNTEEYYWQDFLPKMKNRPDIKFQYFSGIVGVTNDDYFLNPYEYFNQNLF